MPLCSVWPVYLKLVPGGVSVRSAHSGCHGHPGALPDSHRLLAVAQSQGLTATGTAAGAKRPPAFPQLQAVLAAFQSGG